MYYQQGDVLVKEVAIPNGAKRVSAKNGKYVFAEGEMTGHCHSVVADKRIEMFEKDGRMYVGVKEPANLEHQEHSTIEIPVGEYEISRVLEYDHFAEEARAVTD